MEESVDVKALRDRFHAKTEMTDVKGAEIQRPPLQRFPRVILPLGPDASANGAARLKPTPVLPSMVPGPRLPPVHQLKQPVAEPESQGAARPIPPLGVFPRPPPSHRIVSVPQETRTSQPDRERQSGRVKAAGELLQNLSLKQPPMPEGLVTKAALPTPSSIRSQKSMAEVPPLLRTLPPEGMRPLKPKRPPYVNLDAFRRGPAGPPLPRRSTREKAERRSSPASSGRSSPSAPPRPPFKPSSMSQQHSVTHNEDDPDTYDDIDVLPPPPPPPPIKSSYKDFTQAAEDSDGGEIYETADEPEDITEPPPIKERMPKDVRQQPELGVKEQKERQKKENEYRKKFKLPKDVEVLNIARVTRDYQGGKSDLCVRQGDRVEIIQVKNTPEGKWLARTMAGNYGYISNTCVEVDYEEVKRRLLCKPSDMAFPEPPPEDANDLYYDVGTSDQLNSSENLDEDVYDDVDPLSDVFPPPPPEISLDLKKSKKQEKEEKEFRKKFKFEGPVQVKYKMMVDPNTSTKKGSGKDLTLNPGEILEVIQFVNDRKALCRNGQGKYGFVPRGILLQEEGDIYDDVDSNKDVYDNDPSTT
ncbi:FYN-binding protein 1 [Brienomyrus brachyistius]|uniref:FYN-binding protein 1 n=1 Tax=Brienomyrus brachyistius TaxID=42636 RepID=UPI0020B1C71B|nr:FYN-binding protein 1 [Brienomyrus brachyistius]